MIKISRAWNMPSKWTFTIPVVKKLLRKYAQDGSGWADPFSGKSNFAEFRNDLNPENNQPSCLEATEFLKTLSGPLDGVLFDPPYSMEQIGRSYREIGKKWDQKGTENLSGSFPKTKDQIKRLVKPSGYAISFGWNSIGMSKSRNFEIIEILLICHGGSRNDTICVVEKKIPDIFDDEYSK